MIKLTRKVGQTIRIGDDITITFVKTNKETAVKIGVVAPKDININRKESVKNNDNP